LDQGRLGLEEVVAVVAAVEDGHGVGLGVGEFGSGGEGFYEKS
jgi:hypothetical protein